MPFECSAVTLLLFVSVVLSCFCSTLEKDNFIEIFNIILSCLIK